MAHFNIAGKANDVEYHRIERLAAHLACNLPDFNVKLIVKHPSEWDDYVKSLCSEQGWLVDSTSPGEVSSSVSGANQTSARILSADLARPVGRKRKLSPHGPIVWRASGELIGNHNDYLQLMKRHYDQQPDVDDSLLQEITAEAVKDAEARLQAQPRVR